jgi:6,7-dimethyl-8-ribityllumazine synthase
MATTGNENLFDDLQLPQGDTHVVLVRTAWNAPITRELEAGCLRVFEKYGIRSTSIVVPGAVELPFMIQAHAAKSKDKADAYIAIGCVIKGGTPHFEYVCQSVTQGITHLNTTLEVPVIFGVLTLLNEQQAVERTGGIHGHKGEEAALTALQMIVLNRSLFSK